MSVGPRTIMRLASLSTAQRDKSLRRTDIERMSRLGGDPVGIDHHEALDERREGLTIKSLCELCFLSVIGSCAPSCEKGLGG